MKESTRPIIYTLGTSTRTEEEFLELLHHYRIQAVVDVRSFPHSRFEHFKRENLGKILDGRGFSYVYLGSELGGFRRGGYGSYTKSLSYQAGISRLERIGEEHTTAFVCAERFPWRCHRRFIASSLEARGWQVVHIIERDRVWRPHVHHFS